MHRSTRSNSVVQSRVPERPPKPKHFDVQETEPLYNTTLPTSLSPLPATLSAKISFKPKSILKNSQNGSNNKRERSASTPNFKMKEHRSLNTEDIGHFDLKVEEESDNVDVNDDNSVRPNVRNSRAKKSISKFSAKKNDSKPSRTERKKESAKLKTAAKRLRYADETAIYRAKAANAKLESVAGIMHLIVIVGSIITITAMAMLTNDWEIELRRCPLYVDVSQSQGIYWGNERLAACHYAAYMPALLLIMSFSLIMFHGGILIAFRNGTQSSILLVSKAYAITIFCIELVEMAIAVSVACVIIDGVRQTCLSFQLSPWTEEIPKNCKEGYKDRDHVYGITNTYSKLITSIVSSSVSASMLITTSIVYLIRINPCCKR